MYRHDYDHQYIPAMPVIEVIAANMATGVHISTIAIVDSGADATFLPERLLREIGLKPIRKVTVSGIGGFSYRTNSYLVQLTIGQHEPHMLYVVGDNQNRAIIGRDFLNHFVVTLNGLGQEVVITDS